MKFLSFVLILILGPAAMLAQTDLGRVLPNAHPLHVAALGDYGSGSLHQAAVAHAMAARAKELPFDMGVTMGDNFYRCGVHSVNDGQFKTRFEDLYAPLGVKIYAALGNHDYGHPPIICPGNWGSPDAEVAYTQHSAIWRMPAHFYTFVAGPVRFFAIDTEAWSENQFEWLKKALAASQGEEGVKWRIVYGHHPMYTSGAHLNQRRIAVLRERLAPVFKENHVDLYLAGHDHDMEHLRKDGIEYVICGAGGAELRKIYHPNAESVFHMTTYGFVDFVIDEHAVTAKFYDTQLQSLENPPLVVNKN